MKRYSKDIGTFTREMAEEQEIQGLLDALYDGSIELNEDFLAQCAGETVKEILMAIPEEDRAFHLDGCIDENECFFNGSPATNCDNDIWLNISEIEIQFEGNPHDFFQNVDDWTIKGDLAYLYIGYGLTVNVDVDSLRKNIKEWYTA